MNFKINQFLFFHLGSDKTDIAKKLTKTLGYAKWIYQKKIYTGPIHKTWLTKCYLMFPAKKGKLAQDDQLEENLKQPDGSRKDWVRCKLIDILHESGRYWNHNIRFLSNKFN